jgi:HAD superfamily hydrolase (TIGR01509 family)
VSGSPAPKRPPGLVIFDCDGVLVDSERLTVGVEARVLTELGWPHTADEVVERWMGRTSAYQLGEIERRLGTVAMREYDERSTAEVHAAFRAELRAIEGVEELLDHLEGSGCPVCVASSGTHDRMRHTLGLTGLYDRFEGRIFSATEVRHGKPAPDLFLHAAARMGVEPADCAVIEDSVYGVRAAVAAEMTVYGYGGGLSRRELLAAEGAIVFDTMLDLVTTLAPVRHRGRFSGRERSAGW